MKTLSFRSAYQTTFWFWKQIVLIVANVAGSNKLESSIIGRSSKFLCFRQLYVKQSWRARDFFLVGWSVRTIMGKVQSRNKGTIQSFKIYFQKCSLKKVLPPLANEKEISVRTWDVTVTINIFWHCVFSCMREINENEALKIWQFIRNWI